MTNKLVVIINSLKLPKIKKILLYERKLLVPNYSCLQNPWLGGYRPQIPVPSILNWICWTPPPKKKSWVCHWLKPVSVVSCVKAVYLARGRGLFSLSCSQNAKWWRVCISVGWLCCNALGPPIKLRSTDTVKSTVDIDSPLGEVCACNAICVIAQQKWLVFR
jgi:hypothetical protein